MTMKNVNIQRLMSIYIKSMQYTLDWNDEINPFQEKSPDDV